jgi:hypothetical protein
MKQLHKFNKMKEMKKNGKKIKTFKKKRLSSEYYEFSN